MPPTRFKSPKSLTPLFPKQRLFHLHRELKSRIRGEERPKPKGLQVFLGLTQLQLQGRLIQLTPWTPGQRVNRQRGLQGRDTEWKE